jgi:acyl-CoA thioesterase
MVYSFHVTRFTFTKRRNAVAKDPITALMKRAKEEKYAKMLGIRPVELGPGRAVVEMQPREDLSNIFDMVHGGAIFSLIDEAFELSCNAHGTVAVALSMSVNFHNPPDPGAVLRAESREIHRSRKTATYEIKVKDGKHLLIASCQALAYRKEVPLPFLQEE